MTNVQPLRKKDLESGCVISKQNNSKMSKLQGFVYFWFKYYKQNGQAHQLPMPQFNYFI